MINIAILTSGEGDSTENILKYFNGNPESEIKVQCVISNENCNAIKRLRRYTEFSKHITDKYVDMDKILTENNIHYIVLDNYSDKIPVNFCKKYQYRIIGLSKIISDEFNGISIYFVDENNGSSFFNQKINGRYDNITDIQVKLDLLEEKYYPQIIEKATTKIYDKLFGEKV